MNLHPLDPNRRSKTDTWVIAATNHDLKQEIGEGKFREDLYYRLNIINIYLSPLRERIEDVPPLIDYYIEEYSSQLGSANIERPSQAVIERLMHYNWPGNVRELQNILKRMLVLGNCEKITDELFNDTSDPSPNNALISTSPNEPKGLGAIIDLHNNDILNDNAFSLKAVKKKATDRVEKEVIAHVLNKTDWNRSKASKILKVSYKTLLNKITELGIVPPEGKQDF